MRGMYFVHTRRTVTSFSGGSSSAPLHRKNTGTALRSRQFQNRADVHPKVPGAPAKPPAAEAWISSVPKIAAVLAASTGTLRRCVSVCMGPSPSLDRSGLPTTVYTVWQKKATAPSPPPAAPQKPDGSGEGRQSPARRQGEPEPGAARLPQGAAQGGSRRDPGQSPQQPGG